MKLSQLLTLPMQWILPSWTWKQSLKKNALINEKRLAEMRQTLTDEITKMKLEFTKEMTKAIKNSEKRMTNTIQMHIGEIMHTSNEAVLYMEHKAHKLTASLMAIMNKTNENTSSQNETSPPHKQYRHDIDGNVDDNGDDKMVTPFASPASPIHNGGYPAGGAEK
jgi:mRNA-degrading endonuclease YafQ of YafQ-DinJ toxin-antitoxin module